MTINRALAPLTAVVPAALLVAFAVPANAFEPSPDPSSLNEAFPGRSYSPYAERGFPSRPLWGDTQLHFG